MKTVQQILDGKPVQIFSVVDSTSVLEALQLMMEKNVSALMVLNGPVLRGIFTERDYARKIVLQGKSSAETLIKEVMTERPITVLPTDSLDLCMQMMTEKHIRHLPVRSNEKVIGIISIGDVVKFIIEDQQQTIIQLEGYINS